MTGAPTSSIFTPSRVFLGIGLLALALGLVLVVPTILAGDRSSNVEGRQVGPNVGDLAPDFELKDATTGQPVSLLSLRGKPVWLNFWASWCQGCKDEMPIIESVYQKYRPSGIQVVGIDVQESPETVLGFISSNGFNWTFLLDNDGKTTDRFFVNGLPYHVFIGPDGVIKAIHPGVLDQAGMETYIQQILK